MTSSHHEATLLFFRGADELQEAGLHGGTLHKVTAAFQTHNGCEIEPFIECHSCSLDTCQVP